MLSQPIEYGDAAHLAPTRAQISRHMDFHVFLSLQHRLRRAQRILWRWPRPRSTARPPSEPDVKAGHHLGPEVHEGNRNRGVEQELREAYPANDEQRESDDVVAAVGRKGRGTDAGHRSRQYRFCCGKTRQRCGRLVRHHYFEVGVMVLIFASSITLIVQSPLDDPSKPKAAVLKGVDLAMTFLFSCEMVLKVG